MGSLIPTSGSLLLWRSIGIGVGSEGRIDGKAFRSGAHLADIARRQKRASLIWDTWAASKPEGRRDRDRCSMYARMGSRHLLDGGKYKFIMIGRSGFVCVIPMHFDLCEAGDLQHQPELVCEVEVLLQSPLFGGHQLP
jgi:hypothetical protein